MNFKQGDKVVCIDDSLPSGITKERNDKAFPSWIKENTTYTVRSKSGNQLSILLSEVKNPSIHIPVLGGNAEPRFKVERFRKQEELETTIEEEELEFATI